MKTSKHFAVTMFILLFSLISIGAQTLVNLSTQVTGILAVANGGTGAATASAGTVFGRAYLAGTGAPSFISTTTTGAVPFPNASRWAYDLATGSTSTVYGDVVTVACTSASNAAATSTLPSYGQCPTSTTNNNVGAFSGNLNYVVGRSIRFQTYYAFSSVITRRDWFGLTDQTPATMGAAADPAGNRAMFGFDTGLSETTYKCSTKDGTTETRSDSLVTADANFHTFEIVETNATNFKFYIDGALVCTNTTHLPTTATPLRYSDTVTCINCTPTAVNFKRAFNYIQSSF